MSGTPASPAASQATTVPDELALAHESAEYVAVRLRDWGAVTVPGIGSACVCGERCATPAELAAHVLAETEGQPGDRFVTMAELQALWAECEARGELWNGMTHHHLAERYPGRVYHVMGEGWYVRPREGGETA